MAVPRVEGKKDVCMLCLQSLFVFGPCWPGASCTSVLVAI